MITLILCGLFLCTLNLTLFLFCQKNSLMSPHSLPAPSKSSSATIVMSSITPPLVPSSPPKGYFCGCLVPTPLHRTVKMSASFTPSTYLHLVAGLGGAAGALVGSNHHFVGSGGGWGGTRRSRAPYHRIRRSRGSTGRSREPGPRSTSSRDEDLFFAAALTWMHCRHRPQPIQGVPQKNSRVEGWLFLGQSPITYWSRPD
jgi:hypothetical protein